jgi:hypothetical protein
MVLVEMGFIVNVQADQHAASQTYRQAEDVDGREEDVFAKITQGDGQVIG